MGRAILKNWVQKSKDGLIGETMFPSLQPSALSQTLGLSRWGR